MQTKNALDAIDNLFHSLNGMGVTKAHEEAIVQTFARHHRTLQQCFMRTVILPILQHLGDNYNNGIYDGRNEASCRLAAKILAALSEEDTYLPYV